MPERPPVGDPASAAAAPPRHGVVPKSVLRSTDGLSILRAIVAGTLPQPPIGAALAFRLVEAEPGRAVFEGMPRPGFCNSLGGVHGGFASALLDSALGCAVFSTVGAGDTWTTLELKVNFVRPLTPATGRVRAEGRVIHPGRRAATAAGTLTDAAGKLYAHATTTCMIFPAA